MRGTRGRPERRAGTGVAQVLLRLARLEAVRGHHRTARVLPDAYRGGDPRTPRRGDRRAHRRGRHAGRSRRRQLRQGGAPVRPAASVALCCDRHLGRVPARCAARARREASAARDARLRPRLLAPPRPAGRRDDRTAGFLLSGIEPRQLHPAGGARPAAPGAPACRRRRPAGRRRPGEAARDAGGRLRRRARRHRGVQPEPAAQPQPADRRRLRRAPVAACGVLRCRPRPHRDASRSARAARRALAGRRAALRRRRAAAYRELAQVHAGRTGAAAARRRIRRRDAVARRRPTLRRLLGRRRTRPEPFRPSRTPRDERWAATTITNEGRNRWMH